MKENVFIPPNYSNRDFKKGQVYGFEGLRETERDGRGPAGLVKTPGSSKEGGERPHVLVV